MSALRWCLPLVEGRGAGLGNELVPWARAYLMAREIDARPLAPAFGLNARGYGRHFGGGRFDWLRQRVLQRSLPTVHFGPAEFERCGGDDAGLAFGRFAREQGLAGRAPLLVTTSGLWGGLRHLERAREFVRGTLYRSRYAAANLAELAARLDPAKLTVAMHIRLGDFEPSAGAAAAAYAGRFSVSVPLDWFAEVGSQLRAACGDTVQFQVFSDGTPAQLAPLLRALQPVATQCKAPSDVSDLLALAAADLLVCSVSSYSLWAALLSDAPYLWFRPQLQPHGQGLWSIWGHEPAQARPGSATLAALAAESASPPTAAGRAHAMAPGHSLPAALLDQLALRRTLRRRTADLVRYGVTRSAPDDLDAPRAAAGTGTR